MAPISQRKYQFNPCSPNSAVPVLELQRGAQGIIKNVGLYATKRPYDVIHYRLPIVNGAMTFLLDDEGIKVGRTLEEVIPQHLLALSRAMVLCGSNPRKATVNESEVAQVLSELTELRLLEIETAVANPRYRESR